MGRIAAQELKCEIQFDLNSARFEFSRHSVLVAKEECQNEGEFAVFSSSRWDR